MSDRVKTNSQSQHPNVNNNNSNMFVEHKGSIDLSIGKETDFKSILKSQNWDPRIKIVLIAFSSQFPLLFPSFIAKMPKEGIPLLAGPLGTALN